MSPHKFPLDAALLTDEEWDQLGLNALSLKFMDKVRHSSKGPLTAEDLARISGLSVTHMRQLCNGNRVVSLRTLHVFQKAMKVNFGLEIKS